MSTKLLAAAILFCTVAYGATNTTTVGTATVRGNMHIDGNQVTGDGTLFDGSTVETEVASATLRMDQHSVIEMATNTRGIVHADYIRLEQGVIDLKPTCGFVVEVNGVRVTPNSLNAHALISMSGVSASVASRSGEFLITDDHGLILSRVRSGGSGVLAVSQVPAGSATHFGNLNILDGHRLLTPLAPDSSITYEIQGKNAGKMQGMQGKLVEVEGTIDPKRNSVLAQVDAVIANTKEREGCAEKASPYPWILGGAAAIAAGTAVGIAVNQPSTPASR